MWLLPLTRLLVLAAAATDPLGAAAGMSTPQPIATRQTMFSIPFRVERGEPTATEPVGVQLQVSTDRGASWRVHSKVEPNLGRFLFRAGGDGEYWFVVQTIDGQGRLRPPQATSPGLSVVVDTVPPRLDLEAVRGDGSEVTARWQITELNPKLDSLRILYRTDSSQQWQPVAVDHGRMTVNGPVQSGAVTWLPQGSGARVEIRAEVIDQAGNANVSHAQVKARDTRPGGQNLTADAASPPQSAFASSPPSTQWRTAVQRPEPSPAAPPTPSAAPRQVLAGGVPPDPINALAAGNPFRSQTIDPGIANQYVAVPQKNASYPTASLPPPQPTVAIQIYPAIGNQFVPPGGSPRESTGPTLGNGQPRMVNTTMFELEYTIDSIGPSGIARVELWGTRDGGKTWASFGTDDDTQSPVMANVPAEGMYGFRVVVQSGVGLGGEPPASGTVPDLWVVVDLTRPEVHLLSARQSAGNDAGKLLISWEANDRMLASRPVALFYSQTDGGPWTTIATDLENTGQYAWNVPASVPDELFLRIEVRDAAGNLGICESREPIRLDRQRPNVRIDGVRPVLRAGDRGAE